MGEAATIIDMISKGGIATLLGIVIFGGVKRIWVFGWQYSELEKDRDRWMGIAMDNLKLASKATEVAKP
ncbi:MAG TPA: hypothetical protein VN670_04570 [Acidobacteriaceae bacterium]|nr:hypothetical protein [Acidobacteriaceae bacterium]